MRSRAEGFTLLELLVAVVLTLGIAAVMLAVTVSTLNVWRRAQDRFATSAQAKLALDLLERDLNPSSSVRRFGEKRFRGEAGFAAGRFRGRCCGAAM